MKNKLFEEFGDKFKTTIEEPIATESSPSAPVQPTQHDNIVDPPSVRTIVIVDRFEKEPVQANPRITIKQAKRRVTAEKK